MTKIKIRSVGRDQFWSAGRKWTSEGQVVSIVGNDKIPKAYLRACINERDGNFCLNESLIKEGESIPVIPARSTRGFWKDNKMVVKFEDKEYEVLTELDFPSKDIDFQNWAMQRRQDHMRRNEITQSDYAQIRADSRFLAVENPENVEFEPPEIEQKKK